MKTEREWLDCNFSSSYVGRDAYQTTEEKANAVGSLLQGEHLNNPEALHAPALDIDLPCQLIPSSTEGHFHLYIDKAMPWRQYRKLLDVLAECGIIEKGYRDAAISERRTILRKEGVYKTPEAEYRSLKKKIEEEGKLFA